MLYDLFIRQYVGYATYHQDKRNELTHFLGVPPIFISVIFLLSSSPFRIEDIDIWGVPLSLGLIVFCLMALYWSILDFILGGLVFLFMLPFLIFSPGWADAVENGSQLGIGGVVFVFLGVQSIAWPIQILGHMYEGRRPRILENFFQSTLAMMFLLQIIFNLLGWRKKLQARVDAEIDKWNAERGLIKGKAPVDSAETEQ